VETIDGARANDTVRDNITASLNDASVADILTFKAMGDTSEPTYRYAPAVRTDGVSGTATLRTYIDDDCNASATHPNRVAAAHAHASA